MTEPMELVLEDVLYAHQRWAREFDVYYDLVPDYVRSMLTRVENVLAEREDQREQAARLRQEEFDRLLDEAHARGFREAMQRDA